ncbi:MAG TPA: DNA mismatch repair protein MutS [Candidatus Micrarchaeia archaeon]|nr:DNA mismatch repair protein MutS [Candidatus Micrarchaeia archaeon]
MTEGDRPRPGGPVTPAVAQYQRAKAEHPDAILLFRLGDFYEIFGPDAERAAPILQVALTTRDFGRAGRMPMCGMPHQSVDVHLRRLLDAGCTVAICDQVEPAGLNPGVVRRAVTRVLTPGTVVDADLLDSGRPRRCVALVPEGGVTGLAALDVSTGDCLLAEVQGGLDSPQLAAELERLDAAELLLPDLAEVPLGLAPAAVRTRRGAQLFAADTAASRLRQAVGSGGLVAAGVGGWRAAQVAAGALLGYCAGGQLALPAGFLRVRAQLAEEAMVLDPATRRNLELVEASGPEGPSLLRLLDRTRTPAGARRLRHWVQRPLRQLTPIHQRQAAIAELHAARGTRAELRSALGRCRDLERLVGRCVQRLASPRDLGALRQTLAAIPLVGEAAAPLEASLVAVAREQLAAVPAELAAELDRALTDELPPTARDGGFVRPGHDAELDAIRAGSEAARRYIAGLEASERARTQIKSLKVGYNRVFGYYLEVPNSHRDRLPSDYVRKQTLVSAERYLTPQLKEQEAVVLSARERALRREQACLEQLWARVEAAAAACTGAADAIAELDALGGLAEVADELGWTMPLVDGSARLEIEDGRHPLVEAALGPGRFVPNDVALDGGHARIVLLTGPNMAGKSTYLRQVATIVLLAHLGMAVPAARARIGLVDRIFTRVGAHDELAAGRSTFMVEMAEMAQILASATPSSLLVLDEIGRGTSTYDGLSIAQAILEYLHDHRAVAARTIFATHYHELTALAQGLRSLRNFRVEVVEEGTGSAARVTFLHRIVPGGADRSYGIHVAELAGLPPVVVRRARVLLEDLEGQRRLPQDGAPQQQLPLPLAAAHPVVEELEALDLDQMSPLAALQQLSQWQRRSRGEAPAP